MRIIIKIKYSIYSCLPIDRASVSSLEELLVGLSFSLFSRDTISNPFVVGIGGRLFAIGVVLR